MESNLYEIMYRTGTGDNPQVERVMLFTGKVNLVAVFAEGKDTHERIYIKAGGSKYTHMLERERIVGIIDVAYNGEQNDIHIKDVETRNKLLGKE